MLRYVCDDLLLLINLHQTISRSTASETNEQNEICEIQSVDSFFFSLFLFALFWNFFSSSIFLFFFTIPSFSCFNETFSLTLHKTAAGRHQYTVYCMRIKSSQMPFNSLPNNHFISLLKAHYTN